MGYDTYVDKNFDKNFSHEMTADEFIQTSEKQLSGVLQAVRGKQKFRPQFRSTFHEYMFDFCESKLYSGFILTVILMNTGFLIAQTWKEVAVRVGWYCIALDSIFLGIYIMEIILKLYIWRKQFFKDGWNNMDFTIVVFGVIDFLLPLIMASMVGNNGATIFRLLRIFRGIRAIRALRVLRTIRFLNTLQVILTTLLQSIRSIGAIVALITLFMYMFAVVGRGIFAEVDDEHFGSLFKALFTLFQLLTLDDWHEIYMNVKERDPAMATSMIAYLIAYIVVEYFVFLNLFVAVLVDNFQLTLDAQTEANKNKKKKSDHDMSDDEEEEDENAADEQADDSSDEEDDVATRKTVQQHYPSKKEKDQERIHEYFCMLASLENNNHMLCNQQRLIDMMIDICNECASDNMFAKTAAVPN